MKWFKHYNNASEGASFEMLLAEKDFETAYIYWWILEQVSKFEDSSDDDFRGKITLNFSYFKRKLYLNFQRTSRVLEKIAKTFDLEIKINSDQTIEVFIPKWLELQENRGGKNKAKKEQKSSEKRQEVRSKNIDKDKDKDKDNLINKDKTKKELHKLAIVWNEKAPKEISKVSTISEKRNRLIKKLLLNFSEEDFEKAVLRIHNSEFLKGSKGFKITFDWFINSDNFLKVKEGNYDDDKFNSNGKNKNGLHFANERNDEDDEFIKLTKQFRDESSESGNDIPF